MVEVYALLRRMTGTANAHEEFSNTDLQNILDLSKVHDKEGRSPDEEDWEPSYDLNRAAFLVWTERAANISRVAFDSQIDMTKAERSQIFENYTRMARHYRMRSRPSKMSVFDFQGVSVSV